MRILAWSREEPKYVHGFCHVCVVNLTVLMVRIPVHTPRDIMTRPSIHTYGILLSFVFLHHFCANERHLCVFINTPHLPNMHASAYKCSQTLSSLILKMSWGQWCTALKAQPLKSTPQKTGFTATYMSSVFFVGWGVGPSSFHNEG